MVNVDSYSAVVTKVSNALNTLVSGEKPGFHALSKGLIVLLCAEVARQDVPDHGAVHSECSASTVDSRCRGTTISRCVHGRQRHWNIGGGGRRSSDEDPRIEAPYIGGEDVGSSTQDDPCRSNIGGSRPLQPLRRSRLWLCG